MPPTRSIMLLAAIALSSAVSGCVGQQATSGDSAAARSYGPPPAQLYARENSPRLTARTSIVSMPVYGATATWHTAGILNVPYTASTPRPAIVIVHGSGGVDSRGAHYADALNRAGFVTLEIDLWSPRGVDNPGQRPQSVRETLPDAFAALHFLSGRTDIVDASRIAIMGFSWGGVVSMLTATAANRAEFATGAERFAAHAPIYPVCWVYNRASGYDFGALTGAPVLIQAGAADAYDAPERCERLKASLSARDRQLVTVHTYPGATHAWERREPDTDVTDPYSHEGAGGELPLRYNAETTRISTEAVIAFFSLSLPMPGRASAAAQ